jgi:hypothetical protein
MRKPGLGVTGYDDVYVGIGGLGLVAAAMLAWSLISRRRQGSLPGRQAAL